MGPPTDLVLTCRRTQEQQQFSMAVTPVVGQPSAGGGGGGPVPVPTPVPKDPKDQGLFLLTSPGSAIVRPSFVRSSSSSLCFVRPVCAVVWVGHGVPSPPLTPPSHPLQQVPKAPPASTATTEVRKRMQEEEEGGSTFTSGKKGGKGPINPSDLSQPGLQQPMCRLLRTPLTWKGPHHPWGQTAQVVPSRKQTPEVRIPTGRTMQDP